jgi:fructose-bisphosphate aldolase class I
VEPEVLNDGDHSLEHCNEVAESVLHAVFHALHRYKVVLEWMILKPAMVLPGKSHSTRATPDQVAVATVEMLRRAVPAAVPGICFLSGGQRPEEATANLNAMHVRFPDSPWQLSFSYGRALQDPVLRAWAGRAENAPAAQHALCHRARMNGLARGGKWDAAMDETLERN